MFKKSQTMVSKNKKSVFYIADTAYHFKDDLIPYQYIIEYQDIYTEYPKLLLLTPDFYKTLCSYFGEYEESSFDRYTTFDKLSKLREEFVYKRDVKHTQLTDILRPLVFLNTTKDEMLYTIVETLVDKIEFKD